MDMEFEWDDDKSNKNFAERGFGFDFAALIFEGIVLERRDARFDYGEDRFLATGEINGVLLTVVYTDRGDVRRIISARVANKKERNAWLSFVNR